MNKKQLLEFKSMLIKWNTSRLVRSTTYYQYVETDKDAFERGYNAALHAVYIKLEQLTQ